MMVIKAFLRPKHIAPLVVLRIAFGLIMFISTIRFVLRGWVYTFYIHPAFHFTFYGFDWVKPFGATGMYLLFGLMILASLMIMLGLFYRTAVLGFFLSFTYVELLDKTTYLNHYYLVSIIAFLMLMVPAHRYFSLDTLRKPKIKLTKVPAWMIDIFKLQLVLVYFYAGLSKLNYDWLIAAMPLKIWLPASSHLFLIGALLSQTWVAYLFSWFGMLFDLLIGFFLLSKSTRKPAYLMVVIFHLATGWFFKIGMFPYIMIFVTVIFFSEHIQLKILAFIRLLLGKRAVLREENTAIYKASSRISIVYAVLLLHFIIQLFLPFRYLLYPGKLYWTEEGYRFSWRVMLMEKGGTAFFHVTDPATGRSTEVNNAQYLTAFQETMMVTQPDMILQYAHFLAATYKKKGIKNPVVTVQSYVTLNGSGSRSYINPNVNLAKEEEGFKPKKWILPFNQISK